VAADLRSSRKAAIGPHGGPFQHSLDLAHIQHTVASSAGHSLRFNAAEMRLEKIVAGK
jgi:hypothetical protein